MMLLQSQRVDIYSNNGLVVNLIDSVIKSTTTIHCPSCIIYGINIISNDIVTNYKEIMLEVPYPVVGLCHK